MVDFGGVVRNVDGGGDKDVALGVERQTGCSER
jgi:hypothetical protein